MADCDSKRCSTCGETKLVTEFHKKRATKDGLRGDCKVCHCAKAADRYTKHGDKVRSANAAWRAANPEKKRALHRVWYEENKAHVLEITRAWRAKNAERRRETERVAARLRYAKNPARHRANVSAHRQRHPDRVQARDAVQRARRVGATGSYTEHQIAQLHRLQKGQCACCGAKLLRNFHRDHITPLIRGGTNDITNIQLLCPRCNCSKGAKDPIKHAQELGRLL